MNDLPKNPFSEALIGRRVEKMICPFCDFPMNKEKVKNKNYLGQKRFMRKKVTALVCSNLSCKARMGLHPDGTVASVPADKETREMRHHCHAMADVLIKKGMWKNEKDFYEWMEENTRYGHIGFMGKTDLLELEGTLRNLILGLENPEKAT